MSSMANVVNKICQSLSVENFSSPEPLGSQGELIVYPCFVVHCSRCCHPSHIYVYENILGPRGLSAPVPGLYTCM